MILLGLDILDKFTKKHSNSRKPVNNWLSKCKAATWTHFADIKNTFNSVDKNGDDIIFNIAGNNYRLIALVEIQDEVVIIKAIYTHDEYKKKYK